MTESRSGDPSNQTVGCISTGVRGTPGLGGGRDRRAWRRRGGENRPPPPDAGGEARPARPARHGGNRHLLGYCLLVHEALARWLVESKRTCRGLFSNRTKNNVSGSSAFRYTSSSSRLSGHSVLRLSSSSMGDAYVPKTCEMVRWHSLDRIDLLLKVCETLFFSFR
jgi:hypothetical protein